MKSSSAAPAFPGENRRLMLSGYLRALRDTRRMSLREVEDATDRTVSNAYLSQLETGKIHQPSPNILFSLANVYGVSYETLMEKAGYIAAEPSQKTSQGTTRKAAFVDETLTPEEEDELLRYLAYLRSRK